MKVAFISTLYAPHEKGGAERTVRIIAEGAVARGLKAVVITLSPDGVARQDVVNGVRVYYVPLANLYWKQGDGERSAAMRALWHLIDAYNPVMAARVRAILRRERPDVVQAGNLQGFSAAVWRAVASLRIPLVQMLHDYYLACPASTMFRDGRNCAAPCRGCRLFATPRRRCSHLPDAVISLSRRVLQRIEAAGLFGQVAHKYVIHGADRNRSAPAPRADKAPAAPIVAGYLGRMESTKGVEVLLEAARKLSPARLRVLLGGVGDVRYVASLRERYAQECVEFIGFIEPAEFFRRIDVLVAPSLWEEPLGRVIYEGYAHGVPAIVSDVGGMPEIVEPGRTGYVVQRGDADDLASRLAELIERGWPGARFYDACVERSRQFQIDQAFDAYLAVWRTAIRNRAAARGLDAAAAAAAREPL